MSQMTDKEKQIHYRDARINDRYDEIWQNVGKCVFCDLNPRYIVFEENGIVMTIALFAYVDGHMMVIPRRHVHSVKDLTANEWETMRKMFYLAKKMIREVHGVKGMQIVQKDGVEAQSTVEHLHFHCIPFNDPNLSTWNCQQLTYTPAENAALYQKNQQKFAKLSKRFEKKHVS